MKRIAALLPGLFLAISLFSQTAGSPVAFLSLGNQTMDPRYDYLEGIITGLLLYDLSNSEGVGVVDHSNMNRIMAEQKLQLAGLLEDQSEAIEFGKIIGARYLLKGGYVFLGAEVLVNISLIDVETARTSVFSDRGSTENLVHRLAEKIILKITGREVVLASDGSRRSIISFRDETPGSIALYSNLIDAEIFLDGEFTGYTTGNKRIPYILDNLSPGTHSVRIFLQGFGVASLPEIEFSDWEEIVSVKSGKQQVVRADIGTINALKYSLRKLFRDSFIVQKDNPEDITLEEDLSFTDRGGERVNLTVKIEFRFNNGSPGAFMTINYNGTAESLSLSSIPGENTEISRTIGLVDFFLRLDNRYDYRYEVSYSAFRNDIQD